MSDILSQEELDALLQEVRKDEEDEDDEAPQTGAEATAAGAEASATAEPSPEDAAAPAATGPTESQAGAPAPAIETESPNLALILAIPVEVQVELGRARMTVHEILQLGQGSVIELDRMANDLIDLTLNGRVVAQGDAVVVNENFGLRVLEVASVRDRIRKL